MERYFSRDLYGGALNVRTPTDQELIDASELRQVPNSQEIFLYRHSAVSIIIEVLQSVDPSDNYDAIKFHFSSLAHDNDSKDTVINSTSIILNDRGDRTPSAIILDGLQRVPKFNSTTPDEVRILMALYRVPQHKVDIVVTFNIPVRSDSGDAVPESERPKYLNDFDVFARSLRILDFDLFGGEGGSSP
ncbi:hypothetical protein AX16_010473 [Volvariella volvacea WC 439]|nr:hypothetical protein AX16_010473 [Volvariella volvacea WC 439]